MPAPRPSRAKASPASQASHDSDSETAQSPTGNGTGTTGTRGTPNRGPTQRAPRKPELQRKLEELLASPALIYGAIGDEYPANLLAARTPAMAEAWYELSKTNPAVKRLLESLTTGSAMGAVVLSSAAVVVPLLIHHGMLPLNGDPFAVMYGPVRVSEEYAQRRQHASGYPMPPAPATSDTAGAGGTVPPPPNTSNATDMTPPVAPGNPPGVVTVSGGNNSAN